MASVPVPKLVSQDTADDMVRVKLEEVFVVDGLEFGVPRLGTRVEAQKPVLPFYLGIKRFRK